MPTISTTPRIRLLVILFGILGCVQFGYGQDLERSLKAAFLYNFTKYVTWPPGAFTSTSSPIVIGIVGQDEIDSALESAVNDKTVDGRKIVVRHLRWNQDLSSCHVLFVPSGETANSAPLAQLKGKPILIVGESPGFARKLGMVNFVIVSNRVRFEINDRLAKGGGLTISSKLLSLGLPPQ